MPRLSVWAIRLSLIYFLLGFTLGALMLANKGLPFAPWVWNLLPVHIDILLFGFVIQLAIGMAYWILPRYRGGSRGNEIVLWITVGLLNLGIWMVTFIGLLNLPGQWLAVGRLLEGIAAVLFAFQAWRRIRAF
jgi:hypothetical protein